MADERTEMLKAGIAKCFAAREAVTPANVKAKLPVDFFYDHDAGKQLSEAEIFHEIQATYGARAPTDTATPEFNAAGIVLSESNAELPPENDEDFSGDESLRDEWAPETVSVPVVEAAPVAEESTANHAASGPGLSPQARLDAARIRERDLLAARPILQGKQANARMALAEAVRVYQEGGPRQSHEDLARDFIRASNAERAARVAGEPWAMKPEQRTRNGAAFVDVERAYSQGGDASTFARRMNRTGNRRGAYPKQSFGTVNRDPSRGAVPAPAPVVKRPIPALGK
jgi:hypothetical protein